MCPRGSLADCETAPWATSGARPHRYAPGGCGGNRRDQPMCSQRLGKWTWGAGTARPCAAFKLCVRRLWGSVNAPGEGM